ncbi:hypothetical protein [Paractinoplanes atraurantiacus]|uniref:Uncharacterized protein n=1 Tax=Paractinoplanes atraurantiacus TaxID=1036182 RepID=A0A285IVB1_9ACTN|nr:hypothetical protein [Actinoplanes atraurantiacus]SNY51617.1 hypothetical protein SAMN05421748_11231 [Actinoplanes atraurantiacus]
MESQNEGAGPSLVNVEADHESVSYVCFKGPASKLLQVKPPRYTSTNEPCNDWWDWLRAQPEIYFPDLAQQIVLTANTGEQAVATGMTVDTTAEREPAGDGVWIKCGFGGGSNPAFHIEYNTLTRDQPAGR